jgi:hypothetical protein
MSELTSKEWVACSDRLPEDSHSVLVWMDNVDHWSVASYVRKRRGVSGWIHDHEPDVTDDKITHWMELPEGPSEGTT